MRWRVSYDVRDFRRAPDLRLKPESICLPLSAHLAQTIRSLPPPLTNQNHTPSRVRAKRNDLYRMEILRAPAAVRVARGATEDVPFVQHPIQDICCDSNLP